MCTLIRFSVTDQGGWYHQTRRIFLLYFSTSSPSSVPSLINYCSQPVACCFQHAGVLYLTDTAIFTRPCHHVPYYERAYDSEEIDVNRNCFGGVCPAAAGRPGSRRLTSYRNVVVFVTMYHTVFMSMLKVPAGLLAFVVTTIA